MNHSAPEKIHACPLTWNLEHIADLWNALEAELPAAFELRHRVHQDPRLSGSEQATAELVLQSMGIADIPDLKGGRIFRIGSEEGPAIALRAELDALPIIEKSNVTWTSTNGAMHACGHDIHLAALSAVTRAIQGVGPILPLVGLLQPREEAAPSGALDLISDPTFRDSNIRAVFGAHVQPRIPYGTFSAVPGAVNSSADNFVIVFSATGGHAGYPHVTGDPIVAAAATVVALQVVVARGIDPTHATVITVGAINGGTAPNVIPSSARILGTIRASTESDRFMLHSRLKEAAETTASLYGCSVNVQLHVGEPVLINDESLTLVAAKWIREGALLEEAEPFRSCGADDFAYYGAAFPSVMTFVGMGTDFGPSLHHESFVPPDDSVSLVAKVLLAGYLAGCETVLGPLEGSHES